MTIQTRTIDYDHNGATLEGVLAYDDDQADARPAVLVSHTWAGRSEFEIGIAKNLAKLGYVGFALDLNGKGVHGSTPEERQALIDPFLGDRALLQSRLIHIVETVKNLPEVNSQKIAAIGFCFGGLCVLDLARTGAALNGVASFHGLLGAPGNTAGNEIRAKMIAFHGWDDPLAPPEDVVAIGKEFSEGGSDWQLHAYGGVAHAFTHPQANDPASGMAFDQNATDRSWASLVEFLAECFE